MKKIYIGIAVVLAVVGVFYFFGSEDKSLIVIPEGVQSQFGNLRIGVSYIKEKAELVDEKGNPVSAESASFPKGPVAGLAISTKESDSSLNVVAGDRYPVGGYEIYVKEIVLGDEEARGFIALQITSKTDKNPIILNNLVSLPPSDTEKRMIAYAVGYLDVTYGGADEEGWKYVSEKRMMIGDRVYDKVTFKLSDGSEDSVHFDVTESLRKIAKKAMEDLKGITFSKNSGETIKDAILIRGAETDKAGVDSEYVYLGAKYGLRGLDWELVRQSLLRENDRDYDMMEMKLSDGAEKTLYFDITEFFGKGTAELLEKGGAE